MENETKEKTDALAGEAKKKTGGIWSTCTGKIAALWKSGIKGKVICIVGVLVILGIIGACGDDEESGGGGGSDWTYTGKYFDSVFDGFPKDEGVVYQHFPRNIIFLGEILYPISVMQATKKGNLVTTEDSDRVVWVETQRRYEDDEKLEQGYYIRRGSMEYETAFGAEKTVARYVQVTDKKMLQEIEKAKQELAAKEKAEEEARKAAEEARKAEEEAKEKEAAEQGAYELDIPVKSLCGFTLGAPPSQVQELLQYDDGTPVENLVGDLNKMNYRGTYRLAKPFRLFAHVDVRFADEGFGMHLTSVTLKKYIDEKTSKDSLIAEGKATAELIEKKFGIKFSSDYYWEEDGKESISIGWFGMEGLLFLSFEASDEVEQFDMRAKAAQKTSIQLDADAGADDL